MSEGAKYKLSYQQRFTKKFKGMVLYAYPQWNIDKGECEVWMKTKHNIILKHIGYSWQNIGIRTSFPTYYSVHQINKEEGNTIWLTGSFAEFNMNGDSSDGTGHYNNDKNWSKKMTFDEWNDKFGDDDE